MSRVKIKNFRIGKLSAPRRMPLMKNWLGRKGGTKGAGKGGKGSNCAWCGVPGHFKKDRKAFQK